MILARIAAGLLAASLVMSACSPQTGPQATAAETPPTSPVEEQTVTQVASPSAAESVTPSATVTVTPTASRTATEIPTATASETAIPTYVVLRGEVIIAQAVCHYGPGAPYLYKYGVVAGSNLEIMRRVEGGNYIEVRAIGGSNPCWLRQDYMDIRGEIQNLEPVSAFEVKLPISPYYAAPAWVTASRAGDEVIVTWSPLVLRAGDDSEQTPYIVEAWVCRGGQMVFDPVRAWQAAASVVDEPGCSEPSRARLIAAEKHGYTRPIEIEWPQAGAATRDGPIP